MTDRRMAFVVTHPDVVINPTVAVPCWPLSARGCERMRAATKRAWTRRIASIFASTERKATDAALILAEARGIGFSTMPELGENDRSATGFLPRGEFEDMADRFFVSPDTAIRGWERAIDAQRRIVAAFDVVLKTAPAHGDVAMVTHGAVGTLLQCHLDGVAISRTFDQPPGNGGYYYAVDVESRLTVHGWTLIEA